jgi:hypothetical protein
MCGDDEQRLAVCSYVSRSSESLRTIPCAHCVEIVPGLADLLDPVTCRLPGALTLPVMLPEGRSVRRAGPESTLR